MATMYSLMDQKNAPITESSGQKRKLGDTPSPGSGPNQYLSVENNSGSETGNAEEGYDSGQPMENVSVSEKKRRAQNRAAQRAFRERKERHLRDLESRLAELESESRSWKSTNMALRSQLSLLEEQLHHYRHHPQSGQQPNSGLQNTNTFTQISQPPQLTSTAYQSDPGHQRDNLPAHMIDPFTPLPTTQTQQYSLHNQTQPSQPSRSTDVSPGSTSMPSLSHDSPGSWSGSSKAEIFCEKLNTACVVSRPRAPNVPLIAAESPSWQQDSLFINSMNADLNKKDSLNAPGQPLSTASLVPHDESLSEFPKDQSQLDINSPLNLDFGNMVNGFGPFTFMGASDSGIVAGNSGYDDVNQLLNNDFGVFDPLDDLLAWNPPTSSDTINSSALDRGVSYDTNMNNKTNTNNNNISNNNISIGSVSDHSSASSSNGYNANSPHTPASIKLQDEQVPASSHKFIPCADVWDRICSHPRFGEIDINSMCQELRTKARCSKTGVVLDEQDVDKVLKKMK